MLYIVCCVIWLYTLSTGKMSAYCVCFYALLLCTMSNDNDKHIFIVSTAFFCIFYLFMCMHLCIVYTRNVMFIHSAFANIIFRLHIKFIDPSRIHFCRTFSIFINESRIKSLNIHFN